MQKFLKNIFLKISYLLFVSFFLVNASNNSENIKNKIEKKDDYLIEFVSKVKNKKVVYDSDLDKLTFCFKFNFCSKVIDDVIGILSAAALAGISGGVATFNFALKNEKEPKIILYVIATICSAFGIWFSFKLISRLKKDFGDFPYIIVDKDGILLNKTKQKIGWKEINSIGIVKTIYSPIDDNVTFIKSCCFCDKYNNVLLRIKENWLPVTIENLFAICNHYWKKYKNK